MSDDIYKVVLKGAFANGFDRETVVKNMVALFRKSPEKIEAMFQGKPTVVKSGLDRETALRYVSKITKAGAICEIKGNDPARPNIKFPCPECGKTLNVNPKLAGKRGKCPFCAQSILVPDPAATTQQADEPDFDIEAVVPPAPPDVRPLVDEWNPPDSPASIEASAGLSEAETAELLAFMNEERAKRKQKSSHSDPAPVASPPPAPDVEETPPPAPAPKKKAKAKAKAAKPEPPVDDLESAVPQAPPPTGVVAAGATVAGAAAAAVIPTPAVEPKKESTSKSKGKKEDKTDALSREAKKIIESKSVKGQRRFKDWMKLLNELSSFDEEMDIARGSLKTTGGIVIGVGVLILIITIVLIGMEMPTGLVGLAAILGVVALIVGIILLLKARGMNKFDLDNEFRVVLTPFLHEIVEDIHPKKKMALELDLAGRTDKKMKSVKELPPGRFRRLIETIWEDPWLKMDLPLANGSRLLLEIEHKLISHDRRWRNPRGKSKQKTKWKKLVTVHAGMVPNPDRFTFSQQDVSRGAAHEKIKYNEKKNLETVRLTRKFKYKSEYSPPDQGLIAEDLIGMFFQIGTLLRQSGKN